jgi:hypothetical protein
VKDFQLRHRNVSSSPMMNTGMPITKSDPAQSAMPTTMSEKPRSKPTRQRRKPTAQIRTRSGSVMRFQNVTRMRTIDGPDHADGRRRGAHRP